MINPLFRLVIYYFVFTHLIGNRVPNFALYLFSGLIAWLFFAQGTKKGINLLKQKKYLIESIQFEQLDLFISAILSVFFAFMYNLAAYAIIHLLFFIPIKMTVLFFPLLVLNIFILVLAVSILLATINIYLRDIEHFWDVVILAGFWLTPIIYPKEAMLERFYVLAYLNPMAGIVINIRETVLYGQPPLYNFLIYDMLYAIVLLVIAIYLYKTYAHKAVEKL